MKKIFLSVAATLIMGAMLVSCGGDDDLDSSMNSSDPSSSLTSSGSSSENSNGNNSTTGEFDLNGTITSMYNDHMDGADDWLSDADPTMLMESHEMNFDNIEEFYGKIPDKNTHASAIIGAKAKSGKVAEAKAELTKYLDRTKSSFENYLPDQYDIAKNAQFVEEGDYIFLVMADKADDIVDAIKAKF